MNQRHIYLSRNVVLLFLVCLVISSVVSWNIKNTGKTRLTGIYSRLDKRDWNVLVSFTEVSRKISSSMSTVAFGSIFDKHINKQTNKNSVSHRSTTYINGTGFVLSSVVMEPSQNHSMFDLCKNSLLYYPQPTFVYVVP